MISVGIYRFKFRYVETRFESHSGRWTNLQTRRDHLHQKQQVEGDAVDLQMFELIVPVDGTTSLHLKSRV